MSDGSDGRRRLLTARTMRLRGGGSDALARLATTRVLVVGAGGLGSPVIALLAGSGLRRLTIVDPDLVDHSNLSRQTLFTGADVGLPKAVLAAERAKAVDGDLDAVAVVDRFTAGLVRQHDIVVDAADSFAVTRAVSDACAVAGIPWVWGAVLGFDGQTSTFWDARGIDFHDLHPSDSGDGGSCEVDGVLPALCHAVGAIMASQVAAVVAGIGEPLLGTVVSVDASTWEWSRSALRRGDASARPSTVPRISVDELREIAREGAEPSPRRTTVVDVRTPEERDSGAIPGSIVPDRLPPDSHDIVVVCERGPRAERWASTLGARFEGSVRVLDGGMAAWRAAGGEVVVDSADPANPSHSGLRRVRPTR